MRAIAGSPEAGGDMVFVRGLVLAEAGVAIDPVDGPVGIGHILRREFGELAVHLVHQLAHRLFQPGFEDLLARLKPLPPIVFHQLSKKLDSFPWKTWKACFRQSASLLRVT